MPPWAAGGCCCRGSLARLEGGRREPGILWRRSRCAWNLPASRSPFPWEAGPDLGLEGKFKKRPRREGVAIPHRGNHGGRWRRRRGRRRVRGPGHRLPSRRPRRSAVRTRCRCGSGGAGEQREGREPRDRRPAGRRQCRVRRLCGKGSDGAAPALTSAVRERTRRNCPSLCTGRGALRAGGNSRSLPPRRRYFCLW